MLFLDTETVGLTGPVVTIQYAIDEGPVKIHHVWLSPVKETLQLIAKIVDHEVCAYNLSFDWYHLVRLFNIFSKLPFSKLPTWKDWKEAQWGASKYCLRPQAALDLLCYARSGPSQCFMDRSDIVIKRVPVQLASKLVVELEDRVELPKQLDAHWEVHPDPDDPDFPDVRLRFNPRGGLKALISMLLGIEVIDYPAPKLNLPAWHPFPTENEGLTVHELAKHIKFWRDDKLAIRYATEDVEHLRRLQKYWDCKAGDTNSELTITVANCRWRGYFLNLELLEQLKGENERLEKSAPTAPREVLSALHKLASETEKAVITSTNAETLNSLVRNGGKLGELASKIQKARTAQRVRAVCEKLAVTKRFHPDFKVVGTLSNRMAGGGKLNAQGIAKGPLREVFIFSDEVLPTLEGGDFSGFEAAIAVAVYGDKQLEKELLSGKKIGAVWGELFYGRNHKEVKENPELYNPAKAAFYAWIYGAHDEKLAATLKLEDVSEGFKSLEERFPQLHAGRSRDQDRFCSMKQPGGIGTKVIWAEPDEYVESLFGWRRYFTLENNICRVLFNLANNLPSDWKNMRDVKVKRRDRIQTPGGATMSALFAAAFQLQARNMRAAGNHKIQSTGAHMTKELQLVVWNKQPKGIHRWVVQPMNVHDEIITPTNTPLTDTVKEIVERYRKQIPLLKIDWRTNVPHWGALK